MRRILTILKTMVSQIDILETMTPLDFNSFRGFLDQASGFQSWQFREVEILCGLRSQHMTKVHEEQKHHLNKIQQRMEEPTLWESFCTYLSARDYDISPPERSNDNGLVHEPSEAHQDVLVEVMNNDPEAALLCELFVDFDEGMQEWRYRHVKMVERTIGTKQGTGGSDGAAYLKSTLFQPVFPDLWAIRTKF